MQYPIQRHSAAFIVRYRDENYYEADATCVVARNGAWTYTSVYFSISKMVKGEKPERLAFASWPTSFIEKREGIQIGEPFKVIFTVKGNDLTLTVNKGQVGQVKISAPNAGSGAFAAAGAVGMKMSPLSFIRSFEVTKLE